MLEALLLSVLSYQQSAQEPVFRVEVDAVQLDVFVGRDGKAVLGLSAEDFEVYDRGVRQSIQLVQADAEPLSAFLVFDTSVSVRGEKLFYLKAAARTFLDGLEEKDRAAFLAFSSGLQLGSTLVEDMNALHGAVAMTEAAGSTSLYDGLYAGLKLTHGANRPLVLLFTDGQDTSSWLSHLEVLRAMQESKAVVYAVATRSGGGRRSSASGEQRRIRSRRSTNADIKFLREAATLTGGRLLFAESASRLEEIFQRILLEMKSRYLLSYSPTGVDHEGWHELEVKVKKQGVDVKARRGYWKSSGPE